MPPDARALTIHADGIIHELRMPVGITEWLSEDELSVNTREIPTFSALWDTGASNSAINIRVVKSCGLHPISRTNVQTADRLRPAVVYGINLYLPSRVVVAEIRATCGDMGLNTDVLIGMDVITTGDFAITNANQKTVMFLLKKCLRVASGPYPPKEG